MSVVDLGIVRDVDATTAVHHHADLYRLPGHAGDRGDRSARRWTRPGFGASKIAPRSSPPWTTDWISDEGREKLRAYGIAPPPKGAAALAARDGAMPALRLDRHRGDQPLRLDAVQGADALPGLPRALRPLQVSLKPHRRRFHSPAASPRSGARPPMRSRSASSCRGAALKRLRFKAGQHLTLRTDDRRRGPAAQLFGLRRRRTRTSCASR